MQMASLSFTGGAAGVQFHDAFGMPAHFSHTAGHRYNKHSIIFWTSQLARRLHPLMALKQARSSRQRQHQGNNKTMPMDPDPDHKNTQKTVDFLGGPHIYIYIYLYIFISMYIYIYIHICVYTCVYIYIYVYMYMVKYVLYLCTFTNVHICYHPDLLSSHHFTGWSFPMPIV